MKKFLNAAVRIFVILYIGTMLILLAMSLPSCSTISTAPINKEEMFPTRPNDPTIGLIINYGTIHANLYIYDKAGRLVGNEAVYVKGADELVMVNGRPKPNINFYQLDFGEYHVEIYPFYYRFVLVRWMRYRVDLPKQTAFIVVDKRLNHYYKGRDYGWLMPFNAGDIPKSSNGLPGISLNFQGQIWKDLGLGN